jgi:hypothetical protein
VPGAVPAPNPVRQPARDSARARDSLVFPRARPRDTSRVRRDTSRVPPPPAAGARR